MEEETVHLKLHLRQFLSRCTLLSGGRYCSPPEDPDIKTSLQWWGKCVSYGNHSFFYQKERLIPSFRISKGPWVSWRKLRISHLEQTIEERMYSTQLGSNCNYNGHYRKGSRAYTNSLRRMLFRKRAQVCFDCEKPICEDRRR